MTLYSPRNLAAILRETIADVEKTAGVAPDDPALLELRRILLLKITALESEDRESKPHYKSEAF